MIWYDTVRYGTVRYGMVSLWNASFVARECRSRVWFRGRWSVACKRERWKRKNQKYWWKACGKTAGLTGLYVACSTRSSPGQATKKLQLPFDSHSRFHLGILYESAPHPLSHSLVPFEVWKYSSIRRAAGLWVDRV